MFLDNAPTGVIQRNSGQVSSMRGIPKGDRRPPLCRRGGGVHRGGTPSKGSRPYACFWLLFARAKSDSGYGAESPEIPRVRAEKAREPSNRIAAILGKEMFLSLPPGDGRI